MQKQGMFVFIDCEQYGLRSFLWPFRGDKGREIHYCMHEMLIRGARRSASASNQNPPYTYMVVFTWQIGPIPSIINFEAGM